MAMPVAVKEVVVEEVEVIDVSLLVLGKQVKLKVGTGSTVAAILEKARDEGIEIGDDDPIDLNGEEVGRDHPITKPSTLIVGEEPTAG